MAPREYWESFQKNGRVGFLEQLKEGGDPMMAALYLAAEDDAVETKSTVELPVAAFSKRLDVIVQSLANHMKDNGITVTDADSTIELCSRFLFEHTGFKVASKQLELYSPYRVYMHRVLAQRCGTHEALASLLISFISRVQARGMAPAFDMEAGLTGPGVLPRVRVAGSSTEAAGVKWVSPAETVILSLDTLKRSTWSWIWTIGAPECFKLPAEAFLGPGRAGKGSGFVGVMQATGRPFGSLPMALLHTQRLAIVRQGVQGGREGARQVRDMGILLCHLGRFEEAKAALEEYSAWIDGNTVAAMDKPSDVLLPKETDVEPPIQPEEVDTVKRLLLKLTQLTLEEVYTKS